MNITCDKCSKRYSIADEKVRGKAVKVTCKNCQNVISIRGPEAAAAASPVPWDEAPTRMVPQLVPPLDPTVVWFAMIKGKQVGPLDVKLLESKARAGEITPRTYLWNQTMPDWKRAQDLGQLAALFQPPAAAASPVPAAEAKPPEPARKEKRGADQAATTLPDSKLGELFSDADLPEPGDGDDLAAALGAKPKASDDPFAALGELDPSKLPPPGEATQFFINQAGVNKRNPPWKIALFVVVTIALPVGVLYGLSTLRIVPLEVVRVDEQGREVKEAIFSAGGVSGLADLLTGQREKKKQQAVASGRARSPLAGAKGGPVGAGSDPARRPEQGKLAGIDINSVSADQMRGLYEDSAKQDRGPVLRKGLEERPKDTSGGLSDEAVVKVVGQSSSAFQQCIEAELRKNPGFKGGKISIISTVGSSGVVKSAQIDRRDIDLSDLGNCLKGRARAMRFPSFDGDEDAEVHIPLILGASL